MILLDTDHVTHLHYESNPRSQALLRRLQESQDQRLAVAVVTVEEQMRGWLAALQRAKAVDHQIPAYARLAKIFEFYSVWEIVAFNEPAANQFKNLQKQKIRIGTNDLKIASIALVQNALLLSANLRDFQRIPELMVENWLV